MGCGLPPISQGTSASYHPEVFHDPTRQGWVHLRVHWQCRLASIVYETHMRDYAEEGIKHFYFKMLQKDEVSAPLPFFAFHSAYILVLVYRCDKTGWYRLFRKPQL